jgi:hypothetical protein
MGSRRINLVNKVINMENNKSEVEYIKGFTRYLLDNGLIFEINRKILHPLGMALVVEIDTGNKKKIVIKGLLTTEDAEGFLFDEETFRYGVEKYEKFLDKIGQERLDRREKECGFLIQEK